MSKPRKSQIEIRTGAAGIPTPYVAGSRVRVADIAQQYTLAQEALIVERLHEWLPTLTVDQIYAAIAYWREHKDEIDAYIAAEQAILAQLPAAGE